MDTQPLLHIAIFCIAGLIAYAVLTRRRSNSLQDLESSQDYERTERASMPPEIANGKLVISEQTLYRRGRRPFAAKTDQGFLTSAGVLVLVESKTRARMSASDLVQLSSQAVAVRADARTRHYTVAPWGYIRLAPAGRRPYYQRVDLLPVSRIDQLWDRWHSLKNRKADPVYRPDPSRCRTCIQRATCPQAILGRTA